MGLTDGRALCLNTGSHTHNVWLEQWVSLCMALLEAGTSGLKQRCTWLEPGQRVWCLCKLLAMTGYFVVLVLLLLLLATA